MTRNKKWLTISVIYLSLLIVSCDKTDDKAEETPAPVNTSTTITEQTKPFTTTSSSTRTTTISSERSSLSNVPVDEKKVLDKLGILTKATVKQEGSSYIITAKDSILSEEYKITAKGKTISLTIDDNLDDLPPKLFDEYMSTNSINSNISIPIKLQLDSPLAQNQRLFIKYYDIPDVDNYDPQVMIFRYDLDYLTNWNTVKTSKEDNAFIATFKGDEIPDYFMLNLKDKRILDDDNHY